MSKKIKRTLFFILIIMLMILIFSLSFANYVQADDDGSLYLNKLDFYAVINPDGSMEVTETWDIDISRTNTLYKTFETDKEKFSSIENVRVKDVTANKEFTQIDEEMYHVTKDCYYGLTNSKGDFEIAWGVGLDNSYDTRTYEISYTVKDAIGLYNDYAELYWQFIGEDFEISADKVNGTIILSEPADSTDDIKVWGHTEGLNGEIYATDTDTIKFKIENFNSGVYVEVRTLFPKEMIESSGRTYDEDRYNTVIEEETKWAKQANFRREWDALKDDIIFVFMIFVVLALCIIFIEKAVKYGKKLGSVQKFKPDQKLDYFRELPNSDTTPGEAVYILEETYSGLSTKFGRIFSAALLDLELKKYIDLRVEKDQKGKDKIYIKMVKRVNDSKESSNSLKPDEEEILKFISQVDNKKSEIEIKELEKYITSHPTSVESLIKRSEKKIEEQLDKAGIINKEVKEDFVNYNGLAGVYYVFTIITLVWAFPLSIILLINGILCSRIKKNTNVLTQEGVNTKEKWKGLKKYMEDFSLLDEKEIPAIEVWEHYLVYATAFGIADKVLKQLKTVYPNIDSLDTVNTSAYMYFMYHSNFSSSFSGAISSSITSSTYSSGSGGGGGFSGGGGGGRRPEVAVEEDNTASFKDLCI